MIDIRTETAKLFKNDFNINEDVTAFLFEQGILQEYLAKRMLIKSEYEKKSASKEKQRLRSKLAAKYCVSVSCVEKIVLQNT